MGELRDFSKERKRQKQRDKGKREKGPQRKRDTDTREKRCRQKVLRGTQDAQQQPPASMAMCSDPLGQELPLAFGFQDSSVSPRHTLNLAWEAPEKEVSF